MRIDPLSHDPRFRILLEVYPHDIDFLNRVLEATDGLGLVTTLDRRLGRVVIWVTPDTRAEVITLLDSFPRTIKIIDQGTV